MLIDIDLSHSETMIAVSRPDGSRTVSVSVEAFQRAQQLYAQTDGAVIRTTHQAERAD